MLKSKYTLDAFQEEACECIDKGINVLVSAPTGSGKTAIAEYSIERTKEKYPEGKIIYTCPIKSLCNEKYYDMVGSYEKINKEMGTTYTIGLMTGDIIINPDADIIIMTTEVLYNLIMGAHKEKDKKILDTEKIDTEKIDTETGSKIFEPKCVIFDEVHYINDDSRGHVWEKCIISCLLGWDCYLTLLSATIGNIDSMIAWLNSINPAKKFKSIVKTERPVPLKEWIVCDKAILPISGENYERTKKYWIKQEKDGYSVGHELNKLCKLIELTNDDDAELELWFGMPVIFFVLSKIKCIELAEMVTHTFTTYEEHNHIMTFFDHNLKEFSNCSQYVNLRKIIGKGIAYHHSGLIPKIREVVEFLIKRKFIKVVFATETFAVGLNFPVKTVVMTSLTKPSELGMRNLEVSEYKQMAGRAGRRFIDKVGHVIFWFYPYCNVKDPYPLWSIVNLVINGPINSVESKYLIDPNYIIKTIGQNRSRIYTDNSFKFYKENKTISSSPTVSDKFKKLFDIELKTREFEKLGISYVDKSRKKLFQKLSKDEQNEFNLLVKQTFSKSKSQYENFIDWETDIIDFLKSSDLVTQSDEKYCLTTKGEIAICFNEINPVIFANEYPKILESSEDILPILSMFIDDGKKNNSNPRNSIVDYWEKLLYSKYSAYVEKCPKWNFYPTNSFLINDWLSDTSITLDQLSIDYEIDIGIIVKILIKMYQLAEELIKNLEKINRADLADYLNGQKQLLIRHPLKIESLYTK
jgi:superfamily II DNA/RNA helicase